MLKRIPFIVILFLVLFTMPLASVERLKTVSGTGFIVGADGYVLTNEHVIHQATNIKVGIDEKEYPAQVVEAQPEKDLALLKVSATDLPVAPLGDSDTVRKGDQVVAIGCPEGICGTVTLGRVANIGVDAAFGDRTLHNLIMIDLTITHGSSGGPLLNMKGEVIGITMGGIEGTRFGFAIPINDAIPLLESVPGFTTSKMGLATEELSLQEILNLVTPAVVYIQAQTEIPLSESLPSEALGTHHLEISGACMPGLVWAWPFCNICQVFMDMGIEVEGGGQAFASQCSNRYQWLPGITVCGFSRDISVMLFDFANASEATTALGLLRDPPDSIVSLVGFDERGYVTLLTDSRSLDGIRLDLAVRWGATGVGDRVAYEPSSGDTASASILTSGVTTFYTSTVLVVPYPVVTIWGLASFALDDLVFVIWLTEKDRPNIAGHCVWEIKNGCFHCSCQVSTLQGFTYVTYDSSIYVDKFIKEFQTLINAAIAAIIQ